MNIVCGIHAVLEALKTDERRVESVCVLRSQGGPRIREILDLARRRGTPISFEERAWMDRKAGSERHQGVLCYLAMVPSLGLEELLGRVTGAGLLVVLDGVEDPQNLGAILRSAEVAGAHGVLFPKRRSAGVSAAAVKASAGAAAHIPVVRVTNTAQTLDSLKEHGYWVAGLEAGCGFPLWRADFKVSTALVLGGEGGGLHRLVRSKCDLLVEIPTAGKVTSYNVSVAAGIVLYEVLRQRTKGD